MGKRRGPIPVGNVVAEIMARRGLGRDRVAADKKEIWQQVVGESVAELTKCGEMRGRSTGGCGSQLNANSGINF